MRIRKSPIVAATLAALALAACNEPAAEPALRNSGANEVPVEGAYGGFLSGARIDYYRLLLAGSELWLVYGVDTPAGFQASGLYYASGVLTEGFYTGIDAVEYVGETPAGTGVARAIHDSQEHPPLLKGSFTIGGDMSNFSAGPISGADFRFNEQALLSTLDGSWQVTDLRANHHQLVIDGRTGAFTLDANDPCSASGSFSAMPGRNAYEGAITFGSGCAAGVQGRTLSGAMLRYASQSSARSQLIAMFRDQAGDSVAYVLTGMR